MAKLPDAIPDKWRIVYKVTTLAEANAVINTGHDWYVNFRAPGLILDDPDHYRPDYFMGCVHVSKKAMKKLVTDIIREQGMKSSKVYLRMYACLQDHSASHKLVKGEWVETPAWTRTSIWIG